ncbi:MAG: ABC transporter substrate-binding protein [Sedimenticola sp.]
MRRVSLLFLFTILTIAGAAHGQQRYTYPGMGYDQQERRVSPASILERGLNKLIHFMRQPGGVEQQELIEFVEKKVVPHFDFDRMAGMSVGRHWRRMSDKQREKVANRLKDDFLEIMVRRLSGYNGQGARVVGTRRTGEREAMAAVVLDNPQGYPTKLAFKFHRVDSDWKVFDVSANGSSAIMHYRQQFRSQRRLRRSPVGPSAAR